MCYWYNTCCRISSNSRKSTVGYGWTTRISDDKTPESNDRWLIDVGEEAEGMQVIADLHGGNPHDPVAVAEYEEIKDKVREDVSSLCLSFWNANFT